MTLFLISCKEDKNEEEITRVTINVENLFPSDGSVIEAGITEVTFSFNKEVRVYDKSLVSVNGKTADNVSAYSNKVLVNIEAEAGASYEVMLKKGSIGTTDGIYQEKDFRTSFSVAEEAQKTEKSKEALNVVDFLSASYGVTPISGATANVCWNINEAEWVYRHTGKYPAMNCFDYIHLSESPASWIDYSDISVVEYWWNNNGLVSAAWHWKVPESKGSSKLNMYTEFTSFDISRVLIEGSYENSIITADLEKLAGYLMLLKEKNIPVIWRPLHEASGGWFWWGAKDSQSYRSLWIHMYELFEKKGLNNLIWVWTSEGDDDGWYPGDEYVDIISRDLYNNKTDEYSLAEFDNLKTRYPGKIIALSECGRTATISTSWAAGAKWSWFCPWYDYDRTVNVGDAEFEKEQHIYADKIWWLDAVEYSVTRDKMPSLK